MTGIRPHEFAEISRLARDWFGLNLPPGKEGMVSARLRRLVERRGLPSYHAYFRLVEQDSTGQALIELIDALTTNHTNFLRESAHFDFLERLVPQWGSAGEIRIWSAACSTGEEPFSIALTLVRAMGDAAPRRVRILATDISVRALAAARRGTFAGERLAAIPLAERRRCLLKGTGRWEGYYRFKPEILAMIEFRRLNLIQLSDYPSSTFHVIFCRNVLIYFDRETQRRVASLVADRLLPGGYLIFGHTEGGASLAPHLERVEPTVLRRPV